MANMQTPTTLRGWTAILNGNQKAGLVKEGSPPKITKKMEEYRNAGMFQSKKAWLGMEAQEVELTLGDVSADIAAAMRNLKADDIALTFRAAYKGEDKEDFKESLIEIRGELSEFDQGSFKEGELTEVKVKIEVGYYKWSYEGRTIHEFDPDNLLYIFDGQDVLKGMRDIILV